MRGKEGVAYDKSEDRIAQEFELLVITVRYAAGSRRARGFFVDPGAVSERASK